MRLRLFLFVVFGYACAGVVGGCSQASDSHAEFLHNEADERLRALAHVSEQTSKRAAVTSRAATEATAPTMLHPALAQETPKMTRAPLVLLDPGHGGEDPGSRGLEGLWEGALALDLARRTRIHLSQLAPGVRSRLTRDADVSLSLEERSAMANALEADVFVSIHLNASSSEVEHGGVTTFVLDINNDRNVLRLAARENGTRTWEVSPLQFLLGKLIRSEQRARSESLAQYVHDATVTSGRRRLPGLSARGTKSAMFHVLVGAQMPAVLVEASFITQPDEARALTTTDYREALAHGMARGIANYLAGK